MQVELLKKRLDTLMAEKEGLVAKTNILSGQIIELSNTILLFENLKKFKTVKPGVGAQLVNPEPEPIQNEVQA